MVRGQLNGPTLWRSIEEEQQKEPELGRSIRANDEPNFLVVFLSAALKAADKPMS
jgi:hypothetical protein